MTEESEIRQIIVRAIHAANLIDPHPEPGVTRLDAYRSSEESQHLAEVILDTLAGAGFHIVRMQ